MNIAAFFDLDGTLIPHPSLEARFFWHALKSGQVRAKPCAAWIARNLQLSASSPQSIFGASRAAFVTNKLWLSGITERFAIEWAEFQAPLLEYFPAAIDRIHWHLVQSHKVFVVTGGLAPLAKIAIAAHAEFGAIEVRATELELNQNKTFTGNTSGPALCGREKARAIAILAAQHNVDLTQSFAYANSFADRWFLAAVRHPFAVNPDRRLAKLAPEYGWPVLRWTKVSGPNLSRAPKAPHPIYEAERN